MCKAGQTPISNETPSESPLPRLNQKLGAKAAFDAKPIEPKESEIQKAER